MSSPAKFMSALPPFPGGKRRLLPLIFGLISQVLPPVIWRELRFADAFMGGGAVSLAAKAEGFGHIFANDLAGRSAMLGRALVANSSRQLLVPEVLRLYSDAPAVEGPRPEVLFRLPELAHRFFLRAHAHLAGGTFTGLQKDLVGTLLMGQLLRVFPLALPSASDAMHVANGDFERVSGPRLAHYLGVASRVAMPTTLLRRAGELNAAVLPGLATVSRRDALEWLPEITADCVYLDAPYGGTLSYESAFGLLDEFLGEPALPTNSFSSRQPPLDALLDSCTHIPVLVLSMGNELFTEQELVALVGRHRTVLRSVSVPYRHYGAIASATKNSRNREMLVLASTGKR